MLPDSSPGEKPVVLLGKSYTARFLRPEPGDYPLDDIDQTLNTSTFCKGPLKTSCGLELLGPGLILWLYHRLAEI